MPDKDHLLDPITLEIYWNRLITLMEEADTTLLRTSFSTSIGETRDFAFMLLDEGGVGLAQSRPSLPVFAGILPYTARALLERFPVQTLQPGDVLLTNDPWLGAGHHPDFCFVKPLFHQGRVIAFVTCLAHMADIGGNISYFEARDAFEEGLNLPPCKLIRAGEPNENILNVLRANVRLPDMVLGDVWAVLSAMHVVEEHLGEFMQDTGQPDLRAVASGIRALSVKAMQRAIAAIPPGTHRHTVICDGYDGDSVTIAVAVTVHGSRLRVDYSGTSPETRKGAINVCLNYTRGSTLVALKAAMTPEVPNNEALLAPIDMYAPEGCILNCRPPVPVRGRSVVAVHTHDALFGALAPVIPEKVQAGSGTFWSIRSLGQYPDGRRFFAHMLLNGGMGGAARRDGLPTMAYPWNSVVTSSEIYENSAPVLLERKEFLPGSAGDGQHRGGLGQRLVLCTAGETPVTVNVRPVNLLHPAPGLQGGEPGCLGRILLNGKPIDKRMVVLGPGDRLVCELPGGGGFGPPEERDRAVRAIDSANEYSKA